MHIARGCIFQPYIRAALPTWTRWCKLAIVLPHPDLSCMSGTCPNEIHVAHPLHWYGSVIVEMVLEHLWRRYRTHCCWSTTASSPPSPALTQNKGISLSFIVFYCLSLWIIVNYLNEKLELSSAILFRIDLLFYNHSHFQSSRTTLDFKIFAILWHFQRVILFRTDESRPKWTGKCSYLRSLLYVNAFTEVLRGLI